MNIIALNEEINSHGPLAVFQGPPEGTIFSLGPRQGIFRTRHFVQASCIPTTDVKFSIDERHEQQPPVELVS
jgi:hypothetical protein